MPRFPYAAETVFAALLLLCFLLDRRVKQWRQKRAKSQYGLKQIHGPGVAGTVCQKSGDGVDIIFVHGLGSDQTSAWSTIRKDILAQGSNNSPAVRHTEVVNWVSDLLLEDLKNELKPEMRDSVRVYFYGYDSNWMIDAPVVDIYSLAQNLLNTITVEHEDKPGRRIIFVAHSFGRLLVKEALVDSSKADAASIASRTDGILFFGTPHRGSGLAWLGRLVSKLLSLWGSDPDILEMFERGKAYWPLHAKFVRVLEQRLNDKPLHIRNFYEERKTTIFDFCLGFKLARLVVDRDSATFDYSKCCNMPFQRDHKHLNKFNCRDTDYRKVLKAITTCIEDSKKQPFPVSEELPHSEVTFGCLRSLSFPNIDSRKNNIEAAHRDTCNWLFTTKQFQQWQRRDDLSSHNGVLWIKGKPGAGKSTLMKHTLSYCQETFTDFIIASYFFNARGDELEKTILGMLRSLLYQLLDQDPMLASRFNIIFHAKQKKHDKNWEWQKGELKDFLLFEMKKRQPKPLILLVDALDECNESDAREVVSFLESLSRNAIGAENTLNISLSSRHYPNISMEKRLELVVEDRTEHAQDIAIYVQHKLRIRDEDIEEKLLRKANGIFMWVILVVEMLNIAYNEGRIRAVQEKLREIPSDLDSLFSNLLTDDRRDRDKKQTILILQWVLFAKELLKPEELYFAVLAGSEPEELGAWDRSRYTPEIVQRFITSTSRGLIEVRKGDKKTVQFTHESVNDFLLRNKRLQTLDPTLEPHAIGKSHERLAACCMSYIMMEDLEPLVKLDMHREDLANQYPFIEYASKYMLYHAEEAQARFVTQWTLVQQLQQRHGDFERLRNFHDVCQQNDWEKYGKGAELLYAVAMDGYYRLAQVFLLEKGYDVNAKGGHLGTALQAAADSGHEAVVQLLLDNGACVNTIGGYYGTALQTAAWRGDIGIVKLMLQKGADINTVGGHFGTALEAAAWGGEIGTVQLLLEKGADINTVGGHFGTALEAAAWRGNIGIVRLLLEKGADVNTVGGEFGTAIQAAMERNNKAVVQLLLDNGADPTLFPGNNDSNDDP